MTPEIKLVRVKCATSLNVRSFCPCSVAVNTFAVMGVNTAMFQAAVVSRGKFSSTMPAKIAARFNLASGNIKIEALPVSVPEDVVALQ